MFRITIRLMRLMRKRYSYGLDVMHTLRPMRRHLLIRTQRTGTQKYVGLSVQSELTYALYESQAEWKDSGGSAKFSNMFENVPNPPVLSHISLIATHHTHGTNQFQRISPNRFGKKIRRNSALGRQGYNP